MLRAVLLVAILLVGCGSASEPTQEALETADGASDSEMTLATGSESEAGGSSDGGGGASEASVEEPDVALDTSPDAPSPCCMHPGQNGCPQSGPEYCGCYPPDAESSHVSPCCADPGGAGCSFDSQHYCCPTDVN